MSLLKIKGLTKKYGTGESAIYALKNVDLLVERGEFIAIVGASGSGKSTLLHLIGGLDKPTEGSVYIDNENISKLDQNKASIFRRRKIGVIFQSYNLLPILNVQENIELPALLDSKKIDKSYYRELIQLLGLSDRIDHLPSELSGGQQQRVTIARALINKPALILADEPTGNLDSKNSKEVIDLLKISAKRYHQTLLMITHDTKIAEQADRIITLKDGAIVNDESQSVRG
ncbi:ABC transporter ATP-binding protein [Bacillus aquiflavi]|uniref:ABC transporter ATP-binding protein n=1 Tax=Bacillus aquiflavi TaxID=2672567 RepID=A0A6B3VPW4_9BACI|nr:ABC transporter ATP-binding protein [Bacillus aquiflavi]MBA4535613.1 ABC transporter ATP-binding protein [Bacillus aquiflavi]NEY79989.1 ABC transporter ATP-binding protein [Bacillus aquiflavi]